MATKQKTNSGSDLNPVELTATEQKEIADVNGAPDAFAPDPDEKIQRPAGRPKGKYLASGGDFFEFKEKGDVFIGRYTGREMKREKDEDPVKGEGKAGDIMGYYFEDPNGVPTAIGNSYSIGKAITATKPGAILWIEFLGKKQVGNKQINQFDVIEIDPSEVSNYGF